MRKMSPAEILETIFEAAEAYFREIDLSPIAVFLDPNYPLRALAEWARTKFAIDVQLRGGKDEGAGR